MYLFVLQESWQHHIVCVVFRRDVSIKIRRFGDYRIINRNGFMDVVHIVLCLIVQLCLVVFSQCINF